MKITLQMPHRTPPQIRADNAQTRCTLSIWGRQSGKTTRGYRKLLWKPLQGREDAVYWHILQTYSAAEIVYERYLRFIHPHKDHLQKYKSDTELRVELLGNRNIFFKSGDKPENLRTETLDGAVIDELRQQKPQTWRMVIWPMLGKRGGWLDLMTTPDGFDWIYDLKNEKENDKDWTIVHAPSSEAWWWTPDELDIAKRNMSELEYQQEIEAQFVNLRAGKVYYAFTDKNKTTKCPWYADRHWSPYHPVILGADFNVNPMHWTLGQTVNHYWWWFDEIHLTNSNTHEAARALADKLLIMREAGHRPTDHDIIICGDASGNSRSTKSNESDYMIMVQVLKDAGLRVKNDTPDANPSIRDRVNAVNTKCLSAAGVVQMWFHSTNCKMTIRDMERVSWKEGSDFILDPGPNRDLTHASDSIGYPIAEMSPIKGPSSTKVGVIHRSF